MERRELDRNSGTRRRGTGARADRVDRSSIGGEIFVRIGCGARAFAEQVEGVAEFRVAAGARERFLDVLAEHKVRAEKPHGPPRCRAQGGQPKPPAKTVEHGFRRLAGMADPGDQKTRSPPPVAPRRAGSPSRRPRLSRMVSGVSPGWMIRAATPSVHAEAETRSALDLTSPSSQ